LLSRTVAIVPVVEDGRRGDHFIGGDAGNFWPAKEHRHVMRWWPQRDSNP